MAEAAPVRTYARSRRNKRNSAQLTLMSDSDADDPTALVATNTTTPSAMTADLMSSLYVPPELSATVTAQLSQLSQPSQLTSSIKMDTAGKESGGVIDEHRYAALLRMRAEFTAVEKQKLAKQMSEQYDLTTQRLKAHEAYILEALRSSPELIGTACISGGSGSYGNLDDQRSLLFDLWLKRNQRMIEKLVADPLAFLASYCEFRNRIDEWSCFTVKFKAYQMWYPTVFETTWELIMDCFPQFELARQDWCGEDQEIVDDQVRADEHDKSER